MKIGIVDADLMDNGTRHPNLALMKIAGYFKEKGDEVNLIYRSYDEIKDYDSVFISKVFNFTKVPDWVLKEKNVKIGGTGFFEDGGDNLPDEIEYHMPLYDLYLGYVTEQIEYGKNRSNYADYLDYSIGFTTRGCFRKCSFCINKKYERVYRHSSVSEFFDPSRPNIYLWDDNILAFPQWEEVLDELESTGRPFQFRQGIDLRLMTDRMAYRFNNTHWHGDFIFAFDHLKDKTTICSNVQLWKKYTNKLPKMYVLCGYDSQDEFDISNVFERIKLLMRYGSLPYIMRYEKYKESKYKGIYIQIARWCNQPQFYKKMSFREFCERNQFYHSNPNEFCAAYRVMIEFEEEHPEIAAKYFDLKFMYENIYDTHYGFGQKYCNKSECKRCQFKQCTWNEFSNNKNVDNILQLYLVREVNLRCLEYSNAECDCGIEMVTKKLVELLLKKSDEQYEKMILDYNETQKLKNSEYIVPNLNWEEHRIILERIFNNDLDKKITLDEVYKKLEVNEDKEKRSIKNDLSILAVLDLLYFSKNSKNGYVSLSSVGRQYFKIGLKQKEQLMNALNYRLPLNQEWIRSGENKEIFLQRIDSKLITNKILQWFE